MVNSQKPALPATAFACTHHLFISVVSLHMWAMPFMPIFLFYPGLHMQHIHAAHSPSPWITQMYSSQVLWAGKQDQSVSLWPYSLWLFEYMRLKHRAAQQREDACACLLVFMHAHAWIQVCEKAHTDTGTTRLGALGDRQRFYPSCCVNIPHTLTHQLEIPSARMFSWGIFNGEFAIFPPTKDHSCTAVTKMHLKRTTQVYPKLLNSVRSTLWARPSHSEARKSPGWRCLCHTILGTICILSHPKSKCVLSRSCFTLRWSHDFLLTAAFTFSGYASLCVCTHGRCVPVWASSLRQTVTLALPLCDVVTAEVGGSRSCLSTRVPLGKSLCCSLSWLQSELKQKQEVRSGSFCYVDRHFAPTSTDLLRHNLPPVVHDSQLGRLTAPSPPAATGYEMLIKFL